MKKTMAFAALLFAGALAWAHDGQDSTAEQPSPGSISTNHVELLLQQATDLLADTKGATDNAIKASQDAIRAAEYAEKLAKAVIDNTQNLEVCGWVAAGGAIAAAIAAIVACLLAAGAKSKAKGGADKAAEAVEEAKTLSANLEVLMAQTKALNDSIVGDVAGSLKKQVAALGSRLGGIEGTLETLPGKVDNLPRQFDAIKTQLSIKADESRSAAKELLPKVQESLDKLEKALLSAVKTADALQEREQGVLAREIEVRKKEAEIENRIRVARDDGARQAEGDIKKLNEYTRNALETFAAKINSQAQEFGQTKEKLESGYNAAKAEAQRAVQAQREVESKAATMARERDSANAGREAALKAMNEANVKSDARIKELEEAARRREEAIEAERKTMRETVAGELDAKYQERIAGLERDVGAAKAAQVRAEDETRAVRGEKDATARELAATQSALKSEQELRQADADNAAKALAAEKDGRAADKVAAAALLDKEKNDRIADMEAAAKSLEAEKSGRAADAAAAAATLAAEKEARAADHAAADSALAAIRTRLFPPPFGGNAAFEPLLADLDTWDAEGLPGATLARASLAIVANREHLPDTVWQNALFDLSLGLSSAMEAKKIPAAEAAATLGKWKTAVEALRASGPSFSLNLPSVGRSVDMSWMRSQSNAGTVKRIRAWAVYNSSGLVCLAEVE